MQPLQHDLQCPAAKDNTIMHAAAAPSHLDAAITLRSASTDFKRPYRTTTRCRTSRENQCDVETIAAAPAAHTHTNTHTRGTLHRWLQALYTEKRKVSCSGCLPKTSPMQHSCSHYSQSPPFIITTSTPFVRCIVV